VLCGLVIWGDSIQNQSPSVFLSFNFFLFSRFPESGCTYFLQFQLNSNVAQKDQNCASDYAHIKMIEQLHQQNQRKNFLGSCNLSKGFGSGSGFCYW